VLRVRVHGPLSPSQIRAAREGDLESIAAIYAHYVEHTAATFDLEPGSIESWRARWEAAREDDRPWLVSEADGAVCGYVSTSEFRPKPAYGSTLETTIYLRPDQVGHGLGRPLYEAALRAAAQRGFHLAVAGITLPNAGSVALHEALGFTRVGVFEEVGHKLGAWHDVGWWQLRLDHLGA
jgi:phosphinothricin acetyltransferase